MPTSSHSLEAPIQLLILNGRSDRLEPNPLEAARVMLSPNGHPRTTRVQNLTSDHGPGHRCTSRNAESSVTTRNRAAACTCLPNQSATDISRERVGMTTSRRKARRLIPTDGTRGPRLFTRIMESLFEPRLSIVRRPERCSSPSPTVSAAAVLRFSRICGLHYPSR